MLWEPVIDHIIAGTASSQELSQLLQDPGLRSFINLRRSDLLPHIFQINGKPYSLDGFPQFKALYDSDYDSEVIYKCGRQVAKSTNLSRYEVLNCIMIPHFQVLYVAPLQAQTNRYSAMYLRDAIQNSKSVRKFQARDMDQDAGPVIRSVSHQSFSNGAGIQLTYAKTSADRARGIFCDEIDCDEIQDHLIDNIGVIMQSLTQSDWGLRRYTGTAKTQDNTIQYLWEQSSQGEWCIPCDCVKGEAGRFWNIPDETMAMQMIGPRGPICTNCGKLLNVRTGIWVHKMPERVGTFTGYHIPQIVLPAIVENPRKWSELIRKYSRQSATTIMQEILGLSSSFGARLISQQDIDKHAVLPSMEKMQTPEWLSQYVMTIGGVDWGVAEQTSFTVHTVIGIKFDGSVHVLWAQRFQGFDPDTVLNRIAQTQRFYKCQMLCADYGVGFDKNVMLTHRFGLPVVQIYYTRQNQLMQYSPSLGYPRWTVDKVSALEMLYWSIRYGRILFPIKTESDVFTCDLLSPYEEIDSTGGLEVRRFQRNPNAPDDFTHALCFAMLGALRVTGTSLIDVVPEGGMGADVASVEIPTGDYIDPRETMRGM